MVTFKQFLPSLGAAIILVAGPVWAALPNIVRIDKGLVSGVSGGTPDMRVFKGIPYAAPPVGPLRWCAQGRPVRLALHAAHCPGRRESTQAHRCRACDGGGLFVSQRLDRGRFGLGAASGDRVVSWGRIHDRRRVPIGWRTACPQGRGGDHLQLPDRGIRFFRAS